MSSSADFKNRVQHAEQIREWDRHRIDIDLLGHWREEGAAGGSNR